jgi:hypothetical protein
MLSGALAWPILRQRILSERYHTQITELTLASARATHTLTDPKCSIANSVGITHVSLRTTQLVAQLLPRLNVHNAE